MALIISGLPYSSINIVRNRKQGISLSYDFGVWGSGFRAEVFGFRAKGIKASDLAGLLAWASGFGGCSPPEL